MPDEPRVEERVFELPAALIDPRLVREAAEGDDVLLLPDRVHKDKDQVVAGFRPETQGLRLHLQANKLSVRLLSPAGARNAVYEEHTDTVELPVILFAASVPVGIATSLIANWISGMLGKRDDRVRYREAHVRLDGGIDVVEIDGRGRQVVKAIRARGKAAASRRH